MDSERFARACGIVSTVFLALAALAGATQLAVEPIHGLHIAPSDPLLLVSAGFFFLETAARREWRRFLAIPWTAAAFLAWMALASVMAADKMEAAKEFIQAALYFGVALGLFRDVLSRDPRRARVAAVAILFATGAIALALAFRQYFDADGSTANPALLYFNEYESSLPDGALAFDSWFGHLNVRGTFGNRNVFGGFLTLLVPMAFAFALEAPKAWMKAAGALLALAACLVNLSGASMLAIFAVAVLQAAAKKRRAAFPALAAVATIAAAVALAVVVLPSMPRENTWELVRSVEPYDPDTGLPTRRYPEWQAATEMALDAPWFGVGPGAYQRNIGQYFGVVPRATGPAEPDIQNLYLVLASTAGIPAAMLFLLMLARAGGAALAATRAGGESAPSRFDRAIALGCSGALAAFAIAALWSPLLVRGIGVPLAMILALATARNSCRTTN